MELRHLKAFVAVAEELHFGRAAARLQIAQSPLSQSIKTLERELGVDLLDRTTRRVTLRPAGEAFLPHARDAISASVAATEDARAAATGQLGRLRVGFTGSMTYALLPALAKALRARLPRVALELRGELLTPAQVARLVEDTLDVGFLRPPVQHPELETEAMGAEALVVALPRGHHLAALEAVPVSSLENEPFITYPSHFRSVMHDAVSATCSENGFLPTVAVEVGETATLVSFVAAGMGVALVPASAQAMTVTGAVYRRLLGATHSVEIAMCWRRDADSPALRAALDVIRGELKALRSGHSIHTTHTSPELLRTLF